MTKSVCTHKERNMHTHAFVRFIKLYVCMVLFYKPQSLWNCAHTHKPCFHSHNQHEMDVKMHLITRKLKLLSFQYLLDLSMTRTAKKGSFASCVTSATSSSSTRTAVALAYYIFKFSKYIITCTCERSSMVISQSSLLNIMINVSFIVFELKNTLQNAS